MRLIACLANSVCFGLGENETSKCTLEYGAKGEGYCHWRFCSWLRGQERVFICTWTWSRDEITPTTKLPMFLHSSSTPNGMLHLTVCPRMHLKVSYSPYRNRQTQSPVAIRTKICVLKTRYTLPTCLVFPPTTIATTTTTTTTTTPPTTTTTTT